MTPPERITTHVPGLDEALGGFLRGDNVILENTVAAPPHSLLDGIIRGSIKRGDDVLYVSFDATAQTMKARLSGLDGVTLIDCYTHGLGAHSTLASDGLGLVVHDPQFPGEFKHAMSRVPRLGRRRMLVFDSLNGMAALWGEARVAQHYAATCPKLFDEGDLAVWVLHRGVQTEQFHAQIGHIAQVVLRLDRQASNPTMTIVRAVGRPQIALGTHHAYNEDEGFRLAPGMSG